MTYLGNFIPNLSTQSAPLRDLVKKDSIFVWEPTHGNTFIGLKETISSIHIAFYDVTKPVSLEVDASMKGLGACLVQDGKPVAFASKSLTPTQSNYSNIEREMLAVVYGIERFSPYLYGRSFTVNTDRKHLEIIAHKPITSAPPRLQRMLLRIQGYDYNVVYRPGDTMIVSDSLSRLPDQEENGDVVIDARVDDIELDLIHFSITKQLQLREETRKCPTLNALAEVIYQGWPERIHQLPVCLRQYWHFRDALGIEDGIIFKGKQVLIPDSMQSDILSQLHIGHQGIEKTRLWAREAVYWPKMNDHIEEMCKKFELCQECRPVTQKSHFNPQMSQVGLG